MLSEIVSRLQGQVRIRVESPFPERVLNLCGARNLAFWDLQWESPTAFTCRLSRRDWGALRRAGKQLDCALTVLRREGAPYFIRRFRRRQILLGGLAACALGLFLGSFFIWDFTVEGNRTVPTEAILRSLQKNGVGLGTFGLSLNGEELRNRVLLDLPQLSYIAVNVSGCQAHVQVRERVAAPELMDKRTPANVVARRAGLVLKVHALEGVTCVLPGTSVEEGQILISGVEDTDTFGARIVGGTGTVTARTWYTLTTNVPLTAVEKRYTGEEKTCVSLVLGTRRVKFFLNSSIEGGNYDKITKRRPWTLFGLHLPVTLVTETLRYYDAAPAEITAQAAQAGAEAALSEYLHSLVEGRGQVVSTLCTVRERKGVLTVTLSAECVEQIGRQVPIITNDTDVTSGKIRE